jgi:hypothetical protein
MSLANIRVVEFEPAFREACEALIAALPDWFALPEANALFVRKLALLPSWVALVGSHPTNIHVAHVIARGGGRGIFCVTRSGGAVIDRVDIANTGNNSILIQNCHNVTIAAIEGTVVGPGDIRLAFDSSGCASCLNSSNINIQNLTVSDAAINEDPCADNSTFSNITLMGGATLNVCD